MKFKYLISIISILIFLTGCSAKVGGRDCIISQTGFSGEAGFEIYLYDSTKYADDMWNAVLETGKKHNLMVIAPAHHRRIQAGILSWGQDMDNQHNPFQCNLGYQVSLSGKGEWNKTADYVGKEGTKYKVHLPDQYSDTPGVPVDAEVVSIPFTESFNANTREGRTIFGILSQTVS